ncbi:MAG TPA: hypothetical protein VK612_09615, partial [Pyrinomonadaceae bacterium]|nr:hypothetical protein [Pyrinomonadaceae bacterium]
ASQMAAGSVVAPASVLLRSRFDDLEITGINVEIGSEDDAKTATLDRLSIDRSKVKAGETVEVQAYARTNAGKVYIQRIPVKIPEETPTGVFTIAVGDGSQIQRDSAIQQFVPRNLAELISTINRLKSGDRLYAVTSRSSLGAVIGSSEMPNLPPSVLATINNDRIVGGVKPVVNTVVYETTLPPSEFIITGQQTLSIEVIK